MEKTDGSVTSSYGDGTREDFLFTYSEEEKQINDINSNNANLILNPKFIPVSPIMIRLGYSYLEAILFGFIDFFLYSNDKFYCTNEQLGDMLGVSEKTISLAIRKLIDVGLVEVSYKIKSGGGKIRFLKNVNSDFTKMYSQTLQKCKGIENKIIENKIIDLCPAEQETADISKERKEKVAPKEKKERKKGDYSEEFEKFWQLYPAPSGRGSKKDSYKKWSSWDENDISLIKKKIIEEHIIVNSGEKDKQYVPGLEKFMENNRGRDVDIESMVNDFMKKNGNIKKKGLDLMKEFFGEDLIKKYIFHYIKENENFNLDLH